MGCDIHSVAQVKTKDGWKTVEASPGGDDRNYDTFAVLADVRNGHGFAGTVTGEGWPVMFEARGLPEDIELDSDNYLDGEWMGDHSHSHLTLTELRQILAQFDGKMYKKTGMITKQQAKELKEGKTPDSWCGWTDQAGYVQAEWEVPAGESLHGLNNIIEALSEIEKQHKVSPDDIRLVFGFDS
jgi:hypothetical protein